MRRLFTILLTILLLVVSAIPVSASTQNQVDAAITLTAAYVLRRVQNPEVGTVGGEWAIIGLARSEHPVPSAYFERYLRTVERHLRDQEGILHNRRITDYSRVVLALTAAGFDPRNVAGVDLTLPLGDFDRTIWQGINGPIFALLALDSLDYDIPINENAQTQATRQLYVAEILRRQTFGGGWNMTAGINGEVDRTEIGDPDITGMALQALAKYQDDPQVVRAINRGLAFLSRTQDRYGGFSGSHSSGVSAVESVAQVIVALTELSIPLDDPRFVKNGNTLVDNLLSFSNPNGSFRHTNDNTASSLMATEQALYALVAVQRANEGRNSLYRMSDRRRV